MTAPITIARRDPALRPLLLGGIVAPLLYAATVIWGATLFPGYSHLVDPISSLTQAGRSGISGLQSLFLIYNALVVMYALGGISISLRRRHWLWSYGSVLVTGTAGLLMWAFPQDPLGTPLTSGGTVHLVLAGITSIATMVAIGTAVLGWQRAGNSRMMWFSVTFLAIVFTSGLATALALPIGWSLFGLLERITIGAFEMWMLVSAARIYARTSLT
jgi:hypothetical protein